MVSSLLLDNTGSGIFEDIQPCDLETPESLQTRILHSAIQIHVASRGLAALVPDKISGRVRRTWQNAMQAFKPVFDGALKDWTTALESGDPSPEDERRLLNATLALYALPAHVLVPAIGGKLHRDIIRIETHDGSITDVPVLIPTRRKRAPKSAPWDVELQRLDAIQIVKSVRSCIFKDRISTANKAISSNGVAEASAEVADLLTEAHPTPRITVTRKPLPCPPLCISTAEVRKEVS